MFKMFSRLSIFQKRWLHDDLLKRSTWLRNDLFNMFHGYHNLSHITTYVQTYGLKKHQRVERWIVSTIWYRILTYSPLDVAWTFDTYWRLAKATDTSSRCFTYAFVYTEHLLKHIYIYNDISFTLKLFSLYQVVNITFVLSPWQASFTSHRRNTNKNTAIFDASRFDHLNSRTAEMAWTCTKGIW